MFNAKYCEYACLYRVKAPGYKRYPLEVTRNNYSIKLRYRDNRHTDTDDSG